MHSYRNIPLPNNKKKSKNSSFNESSNISKRLDYTETARQNKNAFSFSPTNFQTYPHNEEEDGSKYYNDYERNTEKEHSEELVRLSDYDTSFQQYLNQVSQELELKTVGIDMAIKMVEQAQFQKKNIQKQLKSVLRKLQIAEQRIVQLEQEVSFMKSVSSIKVQQNQILPLDSTGKKSVTKLVVTNTKIPNQNQADQPLKLISVNMFLQYAQQYDEIFQNMTEWLEKEKYDQEEIASITKIQSYALECEEFTEQTQRKFEYIENGPVNGDDEVTVSLQAYNQLLVHYKEYEKKMQTMILECLNFVQRLSYTQSSTSFSGEIQLDSLSLKDISNILPPELIKIIKKQIHRKYQNAINSIKQDNRELKQVLQELISWVKRNLGENKMKEFGTSQKNNLFVNEKMSNYGRSSMYGEMPYRHRLQF